MDLSVRVLTFLQIPFRFVPESKATISSTCLAVGDVSILPVQSSSDNE
ncbi:hypothetical protein A2U01_0072041, partial [Trifolium medium]|nr:hypothetical protein [Trifolium medium]